MDHLSAFIYYSSSIDTQFWYYCIKAFCKNGLGKLNRDNVAEAIVAITRSTCYDDWCGSGDEKIATIGRDGAAIDLFTEV